MNRNEKDAEKDRRVGVQIRQKINEMRHTVEQEVLRRIAVTPMISQENREQVRREVLERIAHEFEDEVPVDQIRRLVEEVAKRKTQ